MPKLGFFAASRVSVNGDSKFVLSLLVAELVKFRTITVILRKRLRVDGIGQVDILVDGSV